MRAKAKSLSTVFLTIIILFCTICLSFSSYCANNKNISHYEAAEKLRIKNTFKDGKVQIEFPSQPEKITNNRIDDKTGGKLYYPGWSAIVNEWKGKSPNKGEDVTYYIVKMQLKEKKGEQLNQAQVGQLYDHVKTILSTEDYDSDANISNYDTYVPTLPRSSNGKHVISVNVGRDKDKHVLGWSIWTDKTTFYKVKIVYSNSIEDMRRAYKIRHSITIIK